MAAIPLIPAKAGIDVEKAGNATQGLSPRFRGDERIEAIDRRASNLASQL
jgi:hypothetical protein